MNRGAVRIGMAVAIFAIALQPSCSDDPVTVDDTGGMAWEAVENPEIHNTSFWFQAVWGNSSSDVYVAGQGMVLHYDGRGWSYLYEEAGTTFNDVWGTLDDLYVVGTSGKVLHYDGASWQRMDSGTSSNLLGVWGTGRDVFAVGDDGVALCCREGVWSRVETGTQATLRDVCGTARGQVFAVGDGGALLKLERSGATRMNPGTTNDLYGIASDGGVELCAVGETGTILEYDGTVWSGVHAGTIRTFEAVCATTDGHWFAGGEYEIAHCAGGVWECSTVSGNWKGMWGLTHDDVFVVGGDRVQHFDGHAWGPVSAEGLPHDPYRVSMLYDVWAGPGGEVHAAGYEHGLYFDGTEWLDVPFEAMAVWGASESDVFAVGTAFHFSGGGGGGDWGDDPDGSTDGLLAHFDGSDWTAADPLADLGFNSVWGYSADDLLVAGEWTNFVWTGGGGGIETGSFKYYPRIVRYTGGSWSEVYADGAEGYLNDIYGVSETSAYAVGARGLVVYFDGTSSSVMDAGTDAYLDGVWGSGDNDVFAVGEHGLILHYDGALWETMDSGTGNFLGEVWGAGADDVYVVGDGGTLLHYDGRSWKSATDVTTHDLCGIWGTSADDIFAVGEYGTILHYGRR